jgi:carboxypeptidase D
MSVISSIREGAHTQPGMANVRRRCCGSIGKGFSQGKITAKNERNVAVDFIGLLKNFELLFRIEKYKVYVAGASYAVRYVSYIVVEMLDQNDTAHFDLSGTSPLKTDVSNNCRHRQPGAYMIGGPVIGQFSTAQEQIPKYPFAKANNGIVGWDQSTLDELEQMHKKCGYDLHG